MAASSTISANKLRAWVIHQRAGPSAVCHGRADVSLNSSQHGRLLERGFWGGLVAGILWQLNHVLSAMYVSHVLMKNDLYTKTYGGSLGFCPCSCWRFISRGSSSCTARWWPHGCNTIPRR